MNTSMHVSLYVSDINRSIGFYTSFFGRIPDKIKKDYFKFDLEEPNLVLSFVVNPDKVRPDFGHLGLKITEANTFHAMLNDAREKGWIQEEEMGVNCCYALQDKYWLSDPDGYMWEVYQFLSDTDKNDEKYSSNEASACCNPSDKKRVRLSDLTPTQTSCC